MENLLYINKVEFIEARYLADIKQVRNFGVLLRKWRNFQLLPIIDLASLTSETKVVDRETIHTLKLECQLCADFAVAGRHLCYRLTTVDGKQFLMGVPDKPFPITNINRNFPGSVSENSAMKLTAEYSNIFGLLVILD